MRKNKFLAALAIAACLATSVPFSVNAATPGQAKDASKVHYASVSVDNKAVLKKLFNAEYYKAQNPDLVAAGITTEDALFNHFVTRGVFEGRACCEGFNVAAYKSAYKDLQAAFGDDIVAYYVHYQNFGKAEKRALVTVEAATAAGITVASAVDGTTVAAGAPAAPAASATSTSTKTEEQKEEVKPDENKTLVLATELNENYGVKDGVYYDKSKDDPDGLTNRAVDTKNYIRLADGTYHKLYANQSDEQNLIDFDNYGWKYNANNDTYTYYAQKPLYSAFEAGVMDYDKEKYYKVSDTEYHLIVDKDVAYGLKNGYAEILDVHNEKHYFSTANTSGGFKYEPAKGVFVEDGKYMYEWTIKDATDATKREVSVADAFDTTTPKSAYKILSGKIVDATSLSEESAGVKTLRDGVTEAVDDQGKTFYYSVSDNGWGNGSITLKNGNVVYDVSERNAFVYKVDDKKYIQSGAVYYAIKCSVEDSVKKENVSNYYSMKSPYALTAGGKVVNTTETSYTKPEEAFAHDMATRKLADGWIDIRDAKTYLSTFYGQYDNDNNPITYNVVAGDTTPRKEATYNESHTLSNYYATAVVDGKTIYYYAYGTVNLNQVNVYGLVAKDGFVKINDNFYKEVSYETAFNTALYGMTKNPAGKTVYYYADTVDESVATFIAEYKVSKDDYKWVVVDGKAYKVVSANVALKYDATKEELVYKDGKWYKQAK